MLERTDDRGYSAIQWATCMFPLDTDVDGRKLKTVKVLHEAGIDINHQDNKNRTGRYAINLSQNVQHCKLEGGD